MRKSEHKRQQRLAAKQNKPLSRTQQLANAVNNLQNLLWLAAHLNGGSIKIPHKDTKHIDLKACRLDVLAMPNNEGFEVKAALMLTPETNPKGEA